MDVVSVYEVANAAVQRARTGDGPTLIEALTYRYEGHHVGDVKPTYRTQEEVEEWKKKDPIACLRARLLEESLASEEELTTIEQEVADAVDEAVEFGKNSPLPAVEEVSDHVYA